MKFKELKLELYCTIFALFLGYQVYYGVRHISKCQGRSTPLLNAKNDKQLNHDVVL